MDKEKIIKAWVYDPSRSLFKTKKTEPAIGHYYTCTNTENCKAYKDNMCFLMGSNTKCKYGKHNRLQGKSQKAAGFYSWMGDFKRKYADVIDVKLSEPKLLSEIGDYIVLPYAHLHLNENLGGNGLYFNLFGDDNVWIEKDKFTVKLINEIIEYHPKSLFGGEIRSYQEEEVPKFLKHLRRFDETLFNNVLSINPKWCEKAKSFSDVGRKALLNTLNPNVGIYNDIHGGIWKYDGTYIYCVNRNISFCLVSKVKEIRLEPNDDAVVVITDDLQVNDNTKFVD